MDILEALAQQSIISKAQEQERSIMPDGFLTMSDAVFVKALKEHGCCDIGIKEWLLEAPENRMQFIKQMEQGKKHAQLS